ncbi:MAG: hypothetical protein BAA03_06995 [Caldibacillus debilis]|nr:MAG: hypothetical protein BAA03_06995 [Caldibacillus debilis]
MGKGRPHLSENGANGSARNPMRKAGGAVWLRKTGGMAVFNVRLARKLAGWAAFNPPSDMNGKGGSGGSGVFCGGRAFCLLASGGRPGPA